MLLLEKVYDWIEIERRNPERAILSDPVPLPINLTEKTDKFGRRIPTIEEKGIKLRLGKEKKTPRILLWSRRGQDRPCFVAAAYMIRQYVDRQTCMHYACVYMYACVAYEWGRGAHIVDRVDG